MKITLSSLPTAYINADSETDINTTLLETMSGLGYDNVTRYPQPADDEGKAFSGIMRANKNIASAMKASNAHPFIILEDDVRPINYEDTITVPDDADAVYLGLSLLGEGFDASTVDNFPGVYRISRPIGLHAVLHITKKYTNAFEAKLDEQISNGFPDTDIPINQVIENPLAEEFKVYAVKPVFYKHILGNPSLSNLTRVVDIQKETIDPISIG